MLDRDAYAKHVGVSARRVADYLRLGELPTATKDPAGKWWIPADAVRVPRPGAAAMVAVRNRMADAGVVAVPEAAEAALPAFAARRRPFPIAEAAALFGVPVETVRRWAAHGDGGLSLSSGPHGAHYVWIEGR